MARILITVILTVLTVLPTATAQRRSPSGTGTDPKAWKVELRGGILPELTVADKRLQELDGSILEAAERLRKQLKNHREKLTSDSRDRLLASTIREVGNVLKKAREVQHFRETLRQATAREAKQLFDEAAEAGQRAEALAREAKEVNERIDATDRAAAPLKSKHREGKLTAEEEGKLRDAFRKLQALHLQWRSVAGKAQIAGSHQADALTERHRVIDDGWAMERTYHVVASFAVDTELVAEELKRIVRRGRSSRARELIRAVVGRYASLRDGVAKASGRFGRALDHLGDQDRPEPIAPALKNSDYDAWVAGRLDLRSRATPGTKGVENLQVRARVTPGEKGKED